MEAICATIADPSLFPALKLGALPHEETFIGGGLGSNNPTRELLKEANVLFGEDRIIAQVISLGGGRPRIPSLDKLDPTEIATDCELVAMQLATSLSDVRAYTRLAVGKGMENIRMHDWNGLDNIESRTYAYIERGAVKSTPEASLQRLKNRIGTATLGQISQYFFLIRPRPL